MKTQNGILNGLLTSSMMLLFSAVFPVWGAQNEPAQPAEAIPMDQIGAVAGRQYSGDGLTVSATANGAHLRCVFQRLKGEATSEGLWLVSTVTDTTEDRFRVKAVAVGRASGDQNVEEQHASSNIQLPATGNIAVDGQKVHFTRPGLMEEYSVSMDGVRQDFVVTQRPGAAGELQVLLEVTGARVEPAACGAQLVLEKSGRKIAYSRLRVTDANGRELPARVDVISTGDELTGLKPNTEHRMQEGVMSQRLVASSLTGRELTVVVNDTEATYPVRIDPTFSDDNWVSLGGIPGANGNVYAMVVDNSGNLYIGGDFTIAGTANANRIAKWDGNSWSALGSGMNGAVWTLAVSDSTVYAGGWFTMAGGSAAYYIAKWDGSSWSALGSGMNNHVWALAVSGSSAYAGGDFTTAGGIAANHVAQWDGSSWSALASGISAPLGYPYLGGSVKALAVSGSDLYVGGNFTMAGGTVATNFAKWDGIGWWGALGSRLNGYVQALAVSGTNVYAGGYFTKAGGKAANYIAKWNGSSWSALGSGMSNAVSALAVSDTNVYAVSSTANSGQIAKWDGSSWTALSSGMNGAVYAMAVSEPYLCASGAFGTAGDITALCIAKWDGSNWAALGSGMSSYVRALAVSGTNVYAGGYFTMAGGSAANHVARWDGSNWSALGSGLGGYGDYVHALAVSGSDVYAGGYFTIAGGSAANHVARWDGSNWSALGSGVNDSVEALAVSGSNVYAGGAFTMATNSGGAAITVNRIAKWNGSSWSALGPGIGYVVFALAVSGSNVYAGGRFSTAGGNAANGIAKWDGSSWAALGSGMAGGAHYPPSVYALIVFRTNVYAGGDFTTAGGIVASNIAKWDGSSWAALGSGMGDAVEALAVSGNDLYAGGDFTMAGGSAANFIAKWDGSSWSTLGSGTGSPAYALVVSGNDLYVGGSFTTAGGKVVGYTAKAVLDISVPLVIVTMDRLFGFTNGQFRFSLSGPAGSNAVIQASTNLQTWIPLQTNPLAGGTFIFTDTQTTNYLRRYYRALLLP